MAGAQGIAGFQDALANALGATGILGIDALLGREAGFGMEESMGGTLPRCRAHPQRNKAINPKRNRFIISLLDVLILRKLPYEKIT